MQYILNRLLLQYLICIPTCLTILASQESGVLASASKATTLPTSVPITTTKERVLVLDVDNTLYNEKELKSRYGFGIEDQIIQRTHEFGRKHFNLSERECDQMYIDHGSTVEGLRHMLSFQVKGDSEIQAAMRRYYNEVYDGIDMSCLLSSSGEHVAATTDSNTGYSHDKTMKERQMFIDNLHGFDGPIYLASNSPKSHVLKAVKALGLGSILFDGILTPDSPRDDTEEAFPTKINPSSFFQPLLQRYDTKYHDIVLLDDSSKNLDKAKEVGIQGIQVNGKIGLNEAISIFNGHIDSKYIFSDVNYLKSKNEVDLLAINPEVWNNVAIELSKRVSNGSIRIVDLGAGLLSMLDLILNGGPQKESMVSLFNTQNSKPMKAIQYTAYESNEHLIDACVDRLNAMGFLAKGRHSEDEYHFEKIMGDLEVKVKLLVKSFDKDSVANSERPHLIIGCCFADLFDPIDLTAKIMSFLKYCSFGGGIDVSTSDPLETLLYFPITFAGITQFLPPKPFSSSLSSTKMIPSDSLAFQIYSRSLIDQYGHNLDPERIIQTIERSNGKILSRGSSIWDIDSEKNSYLWETMLYFFASSSSSMMTKWDYKGWVDRARVKRPKIKVSNQDILLSLPVENDLYNVGAKISRFSNPQCEYASDNRIAEEIMFNSPYHVSKVNKVLKAKLEKGEVEIKSICSLISSGTELKIFKGQFDDAALDVNIKGMEDESMKYPLSYGYSLVGVVTRCAVDVEDADDIVGKTVFTFSPHSSYVIVDRDAIQIVPDGIDPSDAIFMPSVETALSIVHDAHPRFGENIIIYGQGIIGLLVNSIISLSSQHSNASGRFNNLTAVDTLSDRLAMASRMGATQVLVPSEVDAAGPFDVSIEVSGNSRALQSAIDNTRDGGRIIVGSWYGNSDISLKLGIDFHRSHKTIKTSQVSTMPAELTALWSKSRRFSLTWELVKTLKPSRLITKRLSLDDAQVAYELLDKGKELAISFVYKNLQQ